MNKNTTNKKVVVMTGASAGLGRAIAHAFAERGAKVALLARNPEALGAAAEECRMRGGEGLAIPTDVSDAQVVETADRVERELGPIDIWVNDARVSVFSPVTEMEAADYKRVTDVLYLGLYMEPWRPCVECAREIEGRLFRSDRRWRIARSHSSLPTAHASMPLQALRILCDVSCCTIKEQYSIRKSGRPCFWRPSAFRELCRLLREGNERQPRLAPGSGDPGGILGPGE